MHASHCSACTHYPQAIRNFRPRDRDKLPRIEADTTQQIRQMHVFCRCLDTALVTNAASIVTMATVFIYRSAALDRRVSVLSRASRRHGRRFGCRGDLNNNNGCHI